MKRKTILFTVIALFLLTAGAGCEKNKDYEVPTQLTGTRWELAGIVDAKTGKITPLAPKGSYWFKFISETKAQGRSVFNDMRVYLTTPPHIDIVTKVGDDHNGDAALFYHIIKKLESYTWEKNELKFFYDNKQYYLLYKYSKS
ncbi:hypothetical protein [Tannerella sp.]|uniref:hypothetical protein n=1 Tax=Tannerella sp. TaxID=2382127 RepID=UPI0026DD08F7|nr:hypothetical protein [Tannerella sp.]MDO4703204.1 hypothetical protein [Tannerella sp.]